MYLPTELFIFTQKLLDDLKMRKFPLKIIPEASKIPSTPLKTSKIDLSTWEEFEFSTRTTLGAGFHLRHVRRNRTNPNWTNKNVLKQARCNEDMEGQEDQTLHLPRKFSGKMLREYCHLPPRIRRHVSNAET